MRKSIFTLGVPAFALLALAGMSIGADDKESLQRTRNIKKALPSEPFVKPKHERKLLVFTVANGWQHPSIPTGIQAMKQLGEKTGAFTAVVSNNLDNFEKNKLNEFDAVMFMNTTGDVLKPHPKVLESLSDEEKVAIDVREKKLQENLMSFIKSGKGFIGIHAATDTYYTWDEYGEMLNGYFDGHPWNADNNVVIEIEEGQQKHPLVTMLNSQPLEFKEEIYQLKDPYDSSKVHMLMRLNTKKSDKVKGIKRTDDDYGVAWIRPWGKGRVFYCSIGHNHAMYWNDKVLSHYLAGIQWALGDLEVPVEIE